MQLTVGRRCSSASVVRVPTAIPIKTAKIALYTTLLTHGMMIIPIKDPRQIINVARVPHPYPEKWMDV